VRDTRQTHRQLHWLMHGARGDRLCWKSAAHRLHVRPVTPSLHGHWPDVWLQLALSDPTRWHSHADMHTHTHTHHHHHHHHHHHLVLFTFANEVMFSSALVSLFCLLAALRKTYSTDFHRIRCKGGIYVDHGRNRYILVVIWITLRSG